MTKIALLGAGKTGSKVLELLNSQEKVTIFNTQNKPSAENLKGHDIVISFLPGPVFLEYIEEILAAGLPVVSGSTGSEWPKDLHSKLISKKLTWVKAHNFALGMNIVKPMIEQMQQATKLFPNATFSMREVHHTKKLDAPSGTAITWKDWLAKDVSIESERIGDVVGDHELKLHTEFEEITIKHKSLNRNIFASGALWAARFVLDNQLPAGQLAFEELAKLRIENNN